MLQSPRAPCYYAWIFETATVIRDYEVDFFVKVAAWPECGSVTAACHRIYELKQTKGKGLGCLLAIIALITPRILMVCIWLLTNWFSNAFQTVIWPVLGLMFMPYTTLAYMAAMLNNEHSVSGGWLLPLIVAVVVDIGHGGGSGREAHRRRR